MQEMKPASSTAFGISLLLAGGVLAVASISMLLQRNEYKAAAVVQVDEVKVEQVQSGKFYSHPYFVLTEFETIQSHPVLSRVIASLNLKERWSRKYKHGRKLSDRETEDMIKKHVELRYIGNAKMISVVAFDDNPEEAAQLANAVAQSYREYRREEARLVASNKENYAPFIRQVTVVNPAVAELRPERPNRYLAGAILGSGMLLMVAGIFSCRIGKCGSIWELGRKDTTPLG